MSLLNKKFPRLLPEPIKKNMRVSDLIDSSFKAYNGGRLAEGCRLLTQKMLAKEGLVGLSLTGALTPAGLGRAAIIPLLKAGFVDWIISTGANLYHDLHFGLGMQLFAGSPFLDDVKLRQDGVIRIYDVLFDYEVLLDTDAFVRKVIQAPEFQATMGTDEFHYRLGRFVFERERKLRFFADIGIAIMLFLVGLELSPGFFREVGVRPARLFMRSLLVMGFAGALWAASFKLPAFATVSVGVLFAFNSTMLALKTLGDRHELGKVHGRLVTSLLILQDVAGALLLFAVSLWQAAHRADAWTVVAAVYALKIGGLGLLCWLAARHGLSRVWRTLAKQPEVFISAAFAYPLLVGSIFALFGVSPELGALVAGVSLAQSDYRYELINRLKPLRDIFLAPFFFLVGLRWEWRMLATVWPAVLAGWGLVTLLGPALLARAVVREGYARLAAASAALHLAHAGEFALLFLSIAGTGLALPESLQAALLSVVAASMVSGSLLMGFAPDLLHLVRRRWPEPAPEAAPPQPAEVLLFGCHRVGGDFLPVLRRHRRPFLVVDMDPQIVEDLRAAHVPATFGDLENRELFEWLQVRKAKLIVSTVPEHGAQLGLLRYLKKHRSKAVVIVVAHEIEEALALYRHGASYVILPHFLGGNYASQLLDARGFDPDSFEAERLRHLEHLKRRGRGEYLAEVGRRGRA